MNHGSMTSGMLQPMGIVTKLQYCNIPVNDGEQQQSGCRVTFRNPNSDLSTRKYEDGQYGASNHHLQLMAAIGVQPSDYDANGNLDLTDREPTLPVVYNNADNHMGGWHISQSVFERGGMLLQQAEWNSFGDSDDDGDSNITINVGGSQ